MNARISAAALLASLLSGCLPLPLASGDLDSSRRNVSDAVPAFIATGRTTRAEVLLALGEPDGVSEHGARMTYTRATRESGTAYVFPYGGGAAYFSEAVTYRRLIVFFDDSGTVVDVRTDRTRCAESELGKIRSGPCVSIAGEHWPDGLPDAVDAAAKMFAPAQWHPGARGFDDIRALRPEQAAVRGSLVVTRESILFFRPDADRRSQPLLALPYADIREITLEQFGAGRRITIRRAAGAAEAFSMLSDASRIDAHATEAAAALARERWSAARRK